MKSHTKLVSALGFAAAAFALPTAAAAKCEKVSITEMNWASAKIVTTVAKVMLERGYGCKVSVIPSDTVPAIASLAEKGEPEVVTELWVNSTGKVYERLKAEGKVEVAGPVLAPGGVEGWWIPTYLVEKHPELKTIEGVLANPELVGGQFNNCPTGWGCRIVNDNLIKALKMRGGKMKIFDHGSGETLATSMASAYEKKAPWFGYYWGPTVPLGKYKMTRVSLGKYDEAAHTANQDKDAKDPKVSEFPAAPVVTIYTAAFKKREPEAAAFLSKMTFKTADMSAVLAWKDKNNATDEEAAVFFLRTYKSVWAAWLSDDARTKLEALIK
ncbi:MAG: ABC transporter substrate-binding protein [Neomegalonema sp.]|nr:ABC transporter substrate-binding protein [Neomegalonema sp.]